LGWVIDTQGQKVKFNEEGAPAQFLGARSFGERLMPPKGASAFSAQNVPGDNIMLNSWKTKSFRIACKLFGTPA
jgi:hypothetical protein